MPTPTYTPLANLTLGSSASTVTFSSISQAYRDLVIVLSGTTSVDTTINIRFNSDSGSNYSYVQMFGNGSVAGSGANTVTSIFSAVLRTTMGNDVVQIMDYSATDKHKSVLIRRNHAGADTVASAERWANTSAITSISLVTGSGTYNSGTSFALYGIVA
jgi:hypothetical protein